MTVIDHLNLPVTDLARSCAFYQPLLATLGLVVLHQDDDVIGFGIESWVLGVFHESKIYTSVHVALLAPSRDAVEHFYQTGLASGGRCNGVPGLRPEYGEHYYAAYLLDPDGHNIEALVRNRPTPHNAQR